MTQEQSDKDSLAAYVADLERRASEQKEWEQHPKCESSGIGDAMQGIAAELREKFLNVAVPETGTNNAAGQAGACPGVGSTPTPAAPLTGDTPRTDAPACDFKHRLLCPRDAWQTARIEQLERHCAAWKLLAKQNEETAADALRQRDEARLAIEGMRGPLANAVALSASGHPCDFRGYTTTNTSAAEPVSTSGLMDEAGKFFDWGNAASVALRNLLEAYERRIRSLCTTPEELAAKPWECAEYLEARRALVDKPNWFVNVSATQQNNTASTTAPKG